MKMTLNKIKRCVYVHVYFLSDKKSDFLICLPNLDLTAKVETQLQKQVIGLNITIIEKSKR